MTPDHSPDQERYRATPMRLVPMALQSVVLPNAVPQPCGYASARVLTGRSTTYRVRSGPRAGGPAGLDDRARERRPMRVYISVDMEGIGGISHPHPTDREGCPLPGLGRPHGRRGQRGDRGGAGRRRDRHPRQRQPRLDVQPAARGDQPGGDAPPGPEGVVDGRRSRPDWRSTSRCSSATTPVPATRAGRSRTPIRAGRSRRGSMAGRPASTA